MFDGGRQVLSMVNKIVSNVMSNIIALRTYTVGICTFCEVGFSTNKICLQLIVQLILFVHCSVETDKSDKIMLMFYFYAYLAEV